MHMSNRQDPFRYEFEMPIMGEFRLLRIDQRHVTHGYGSLEMLDMSYHGARIVTKVDFQANKHEIELSIIITINDEPMTVDGMIVYQISHGVEYVYGLRLHTDEAILRRITDELKVYARRRLGRR